MNNFQEKMERMFREEEALSSYIKNLEDLASTLLITGITGISISRTLVILKFV